LKLLLCCNFIYLRQEAICFGGLLVIPVTKTTNGLILTCFSLLFCFISCTNKLRVACRYGLFILLPKGTATSAVPVFVFVLAVCKYTRICKDVCRIAFVCNYCARPVKFTVNFSVTSFGFYLLYAVTFHVLLQFVEVVGVHSLNFCASWYIYVMEVQHPL